MDLGPIPFTMTDWSTVPAVEHKGERGTSHWRAFESGRLRVRMVDYSPAYRSDHWCPRGHVFLVLEGEFIITLKDGRIFSLGPGQGFVAGDDRTDPHLGATETGARAFIID